VASIVRHDRNHARSSRADRAMRSVVEGRAGPMVGAVSVFGFRMRVYGGRHLPLLVVIMIWTPFFSVETQKCA